MIEEVSGRERESVSGRECEWKRVCEWERESGKARMGERENVS